MMSSHNVSSINELVEGNRMLLNGKTISKNIRRENNTQQQQQSHLNDDNESNVFVRNTGYSIADLSHASRDPMVAGPKELFNKNVIKIE